MKLKARVEFFGTVFIVFRDQMKMFLSWEESFIPSLRFYPTADYCVMDEAHKKVLHKMYENETCGLTYVNRAESCRFFSSYGSC